MSNQPPPIKFSVQYNLQLTTCAYFDNLEFDSLMQISIMFMETQDLGAKLFTSFLFLPLFHWHYIELAVKSHLRRYHCS